MYVPETKFKGGEYYEQARELPGFIAQLTSGDGCT